MSEQEQDAIAGKIVTEYVRVRRELASLLDKTAEYSKILDDVSAHLKPRAGTTHHQNLSAESLTEKLQKYPTKDELSEVAKEIEAASRRKRELSQSLKDIGIEPKE